MEWKISHDLVPYEEALAFMEARVAAIRAGEAEECVWLLEHPPLYTAGTSAKAEDLVEAEQFPVFETGRGGQYTYHGPGQRVAYIMLDLKKRAEVEFRVQSSEFSSDQEKEQGKKVKPLGLGAQGNEASSEELASHQPAERRLTASAAGEQEAIKKRAQPDIRKFVKQLEQLIIQTLAQFGVDGFTADERIGVWVKEERLGIRDWGLEASSLRGVPCATRQPPASMGNGQWLMVNQKETERGQKTNHGDIGRYESASVGAPLQSAQPLGSSRETEVQRGSERKTKERFTHEMRESKIAALGIRVRHWVTFHGISINVNPDLSHFNGIIPCGISPQEYGVTSLYALGKEVPMAQLDEALKAEFKEVFGC